MRLVIRKRTLQDLGLARRASCCVPCTWVQVPASACMDDAWHISWLLLCYPGQCLLCYTGSCFDLRHRAVCASKQWPKLRAIMQSSCGVLHAALHFLCFKERPALSFRTELSALGQAYSMRPTAPIFVAEREFVLHLQWALQSTHCIFLGIV